MVDPTPVKPMEAFKNRYGRIGKKNTDKPDVTPKPQTDKPKKDKKKPNSINDLENLGELIDETKETKEPEEKGDKTMTDTFIPSAIQKWACLYAKIDYKDYHNEDSLLKALNNKGVKIQGNQVIDLTMESLVYTSHLTTNEERKAEEARKYALRDDGYDVPALPLEEKEELRFHEGTAKQETHENDDMHWIDKKIADYTAMKEAGNTDIKEFNGDKSAGTFTAEVDNGTVTYTSENDVSITKDSSFKVFDTVMKEPSNAGKAVRIPAEASNEFKTNLFIAAILNGHKVNGAEGLELDEATLNKINLNDEQKAMILAALPKKEEKTEDKVEEKTEEKPEEKPEAKTEEKPEEKTEEKPEAKTEEKPEAKTEENTVENARGRIAKSAERVSQYTEDINHLSGEYSGYNTSTITVKHKRRNSLREGNSNDI